MHLPKRSTEKPRFKSPKGGDTLGENLLHQQFNPSSPNLVWASDFTYVNVGGHFCYLCVVIDLFSRKVIGWHTAIRHSVELTMTAAKKAFDSRGNPSSVLFHSDRGAEYTASAFREFLETYHALQSFSRKGYPYDNACCESFFKQMKRECLNRKTFHNKEEFRLTCFEYIERYNAKRPHASLGYLTPNEAEDNYWHNDHSLSHSHKN